MSLSMLRRFGNTTCFLIRQWGELVCQRYNKTYTSSKWTWMLHVSCSCASFRLPRWSLFFARTLFVMWHRRSQNDGWTNNEKMKKQLLAVLGLMFLRNYAFAYDETIDGYPIEWVSVLPSNYTGYIYGGYLDKRADFFYLVGVSFKNSVSAFPNCTAPLPTHWLKRM